MQSHQNSRISQAESSYSYSQPHTHSNPKSPFWHNHPSCHLQDYIETDYSFRPEIHELPTSIYPLRDKLDISKDERFQRLIENQLEKQEERYRVKVDQQQKEVRQFCTFQPNAGKVEVDDQQEVFDRLYEEGLQKHREKQRATPGQNANCTFHPKTNKSNILNSEKTNLQPIYLRFRQEIRKELQRKADLKRRVLQEEQSKLTPFTINSQSERILERKENFNGNVVERLLDYMKQANHKKKQRVELQERNLNQQLTFAPTINPLTIQLPGEDFIERQEILALEGRAKLLTKFQEISRESCPFKPKVSVISDYLINAKRADENKDQKIQRMHSQYPLIRLENIQRIQQQAYRDCTFHPEINTISKQLDANHVHHCCDRPKHKEFSHKPKLNENSLKMAANRRTHSVHCSQNKADKLRMQIDYKQMRECTFRPKTLTSIAKSQVTISGINGFDKFIRNKELRLKQEQSQKQVEEKLFRMEKRYDQRVEKNTKIEEFKLSKSNKDAKALERQEQQKFVSSCTFKPNAGKNKKPFDRMMC